MATRRRFLAIAASVGAAAALPARHASAASVARQPSHASEPPAQAATSVWKGTALGALASMTLVHPDQAHARATIERCVREIDRLESIFSLYRPRSALVHLNAAGRLADPPAELVELLSFALALARGSGGAFDPTVQPLYRLYADHFARPAASPDGPSARSIAQVLESVGFEAIELDAGSIRFGRPRMAVTLNGIAQGFVTDRVGELLRRAGFHDVLIDIGEALAVGHRADGREWRAAIADPLHANRDLFELQLGNGPGRLPALATSSGRGTRFSPATQLHHLLDPRSGRCAEHYASVSVAAPRATVADGLSTTLSVLAPAQAALLLRSWPTARAWFVDPDGRLT